MRIGVTERGDASIDFSWVSKCEQMDGNILITKNITEKFIDTVIDLYNRGIKLIVHCTCTGYGGTVLEPNVPDYKIQIAQLKQLIDRGFPPSYCVFRIDPIFPSVKGLNRVDEVITHFIQAKTRVKRVRVSIVDEYKYVKERYRKLGWNPLYGDDFGPSDEQISMVAETLNKYDFIYETCAENKLSALLDISERIGCVSKMDLYMMDIKLTSMSTNPQQRSGCSCLSYKTELLTEKKQCPNKCVYCFWR